MTDLVLVRHGATEWNETKRAQGHADIPLSDLGRRQAVGIAQELAHLPVVGVYSSDLIRAYDTAAPIARLHDLEVRKDPDLREIDQGEWTGLHTDEIRARWPALWGAARHYSSRPGGESPAMVRARALRALRRIVEEYPDGTVVIVSHGGTIRWLSAEALGYDDVSAARLRGLVNGGGVALQGRLNDGHLVLSDLKRLDGSSTDRDDPNV